jgi:hypothetical protein
VRQALALIEQANLSALTAESATALVAQAFRDYVNRNVICSGEMLLFRARPCATAALYPNALDLWGCQAKHVSRRGRFNQAFDPRVYCSLDPTAVFFEVRPAPSSYLTILVAAKVNADTPIKLAPMGLQKYREWETVIPGLLNGNGFSEMLEQRGALERWQLQNDFLTEIATAVHDASVELDAYKVSNATAEFLSSAFNMGLLYPSVATKGHHLNVCLEPTQADQAFRPIEAWHVRIGRQDFRPEPENGRWTELSFEVERHSDVIHSDGTIEWGELDHFRIEDIGAAHRRLQSGFHSKSLPPSFADIRVTAQRPIFDADHPQVRKHLPDEAPRNAGEAQRGG